MASEIKLRIKVDDDGSLNIVAKEAQKAAKSTDRLTQSTDRAKTARDRYSKGEKGVAQAGMNSTKAFSKMNQTMIGSSGLVGAYATLAANVFALTAAFGILQRAAAAQQLAEGLAYTGEVAGRNLPYIADRLKEITGEAVSTQEAMSAVALATSSGFSSDQIARLGNVAKGASLALGRDMTDSLNRLIRGAAKLEPELLDELGIMVRLDQASREYARTLGTTEANLTHFQKRQAFVTAIIREGEMAFSGIAEEIDPNAYDQLAASLQDLLKSFVTLINKGLIPVVKFFSKSPLALAGGAMLFASTIRGQLLPGLTQGAKRLAEFAGEQRASAEAAIGQVKTGGKLPKVYGAITTKIKEGTATTKDFSQAQRSLDQSIAAHNTQLEKHVNYQNKSSQAYADKQATIDRLRIAQDNLTRVQITGAQATTAQAKANTLAAASSMNVVGAVKGIRVAMAAYRIELQATAVANGLTSVSFKALRVAIFTAGLSLKAFGAFLLAAMPWLAMIPLVIGAGKAAWDKFFGDSATLKKQKEILESFKHITETGNRLTQTLENIARIDPPDKKWREFNAILKATAGISKQVRDRLLETMNVELVAKANAYTEALKEQTKAQDRVNRTAETYAHTTNPFQKALDDATEKVKVLKEGLNKLDAANQIMFLQTAIDKAGETGDPKQIALWEKMITQIRILAVEGEITRESLNAVLHQKSEAEGTSELLDSMRAGLTTFSEELGKLKEKTSTPFDKMSEGLGEALKTITQTEEGTKKLTSISQALVDALGEEGGNLLKNAMEDFKLEGEKAGQTLKRLKESIDKNIKTMQEAPGLVKKEQAELKKLSEARKVDVAVTKKAQEIEDNILRIKENALLAEQDNLKILNLREDQSAALLKNEAELAALRASRKTEGQRILEQTEAEVAAAKLILDLAKKHKQLLDESISRREKILKMQAAQAGFADPRRRSGALTAKEERAIQAELLKDREKSIKFAYNLKKKEIDLEYTLLMAKAFLIEEQLRLIDAETKAIGYYKETLIKLYNLSQKGALEQRDADLRLVGDTTAADEAVRDSAMAAFEKGETIGERFYEGFYGADSAFDELNLSEKFQALHKGMQPLLEDLRSLGPQGEVVAEMSSGLLMFGDNLATFVQVFDENASIIKGDFLSMKAGAMEFSDFISTPEFVETAIAGLSMLSSAIGSLASVMAAASKNRIAGIDAEIKAEQKRDGKSAQSVAKMKALEKKKEAEKRKAFEQNKKMMIAQAIMSTAAGAIGVFGGVRDFVTFGTAVALSAMIAAMGAAQIAIISGMTYQGGGSGGGAATPGSISVGQRRQSVDTASSRGGAGELAYFRGERGTGGPEDFRGAFYGRRHRAMGGATGYVVGEQGPELFMPDRPGTIVPADDTAAAAGAAGAVTFNINTVDATGVEDLLMEQQGNIIGMIRQAANSYGEEFMEDVDVTAFTPAAVRRA